MVLFPFLTSRTAPRGIYMKLSKEYREAVSFTQRVDVSCFADLCSEGASLEISLQSRGIRGRSYSIGAQELVGGNQCESHSSFADASVLHTIQLARVASRFGTDQQCTN